MTRREKITLVACMAISLDDYFKYKKAHNFYGHSTAYGHFCGVRYFVRAVFTNADDVIKEMMHDIEENGRLQPWQIAEYADKLEK